MEKQKAVLYCRVARLSDEEKEKVNQVARFKELFGFEPTEIYTDISKSGRDNNRPEYRRLIDDALSGNIDYIAVKCLAKFNRNMAATIKVLRQLCDKGVGVCMMNENLDTLKQISMVHDTLIELLGRTAKKHQGWQNNG